MLIRQPNGLYCFYDEVDDTVTKWNITEKEYIRMVLKKARKNTLNNLEHAEDIQIIYDNFIPDNDTMSKEKFDSFLKVIGSKETYDSIHNLNS